MLEQFFIKPSTIDRLRGSWIAAEIEAYVAWLVDERFSAKSVWRRVPIVFAFGEFTRREGQTRSPNCLCTSTRSWTTASPTITDGLARRDRWKRR